MQLNTTCTLIRVFKLNLLFLFYGSGGGIGGGSIESCFGFNSPFFRFSGNLSCFPLIKNWKMFPHLFQIYSLYPIIYHLLHLYTH